MSEAPAVSYQQGLDIERAVADQLAGLGWRVEVQPIIGTGRPDLVATDTQGRPFVLEVKLTQRAPHFAAIAQVAAYVRLAEETRGWSGVRGVLLTTAPKAQEDSPAETLGIWIISYDASKHRGKARAGPEIMEIARTWADELSRRAMATDSL